jgi:hypothetical protein
MRSILYVIMFKNNRQFYLLLAVLIIVATTIIFLPRLLVHKTKSTNDQIYTDKEFGYSVAVPSGWSINSSSNPVQFFTPALDSSGSSILHMEIFATPQDLVLDNYISSLSASTSNTYKKLQINGKSVYEESSDSTSSGFLSYYFQNPNYPTLYILTFSSDFTNQPSIISQILSSFNFSLPVSDSIVPLPTAATSSAQNSCPPAGWINCMPSVGTKNADCTQNYVDWATQNCPDFKGVAY